MITLTLDWHEVLWFLAGAMSGSHLRWSAYEDMVNRVWPQCTEQERRSIFLIMRRDLGYWWRPEGFRGDDPNLRGEGPWKAAIKREQDDACISHAEREQARTKFKADNQGYAIDRTNPEAKPRQVITDLTPWRYFRQVLARFDPDRQYAVTLRADSQKEARTVYDDTQRRGILIPRPDDYCEGHRNGRLTVTVRAYQWQQDYRIDWNKRCDPDRIVSVEKMEIPDTGEM
jgi:hypothetical protein